MVTYLDLGNTASDFSNTADEFVTRYKWELSPALGTGYIRVANTAVEYFHLDVLLAQVPSVDDDWLDLFSLGGNAPSSDWVLSFDWTWKAEVVFHKITVLIVINFC